MTVAWRWLIANDRLADDWRRPVFAFLVWRPWKFILFGVVLAAAAGFSAEGSERFFATLETYGVLGLALALSSRIVGGDRSPDRHLLLFQLPGSQLGHYRRLFVLALATQVVLIAAVWSAGAAAAASVGRQPPWHVLVGAEVYGVELLAFGILASAFVSAGDAAITFVWNLAPLILTLALDRFQLAPSAKLALESPFIPFNAFFAFQSALEAGSWLAWRPAWGVQLVAFPVVCLATAAWRIRALERRGLG